MKKFLINNFISYFFGFFLVFSSNASSSESDEASSSESDSTASTGGCASNTFIGQQQADGSWKTVCKE